MWRIEELAEMVAQVLRATGYLGPPSARVRAVPDARTIRYYTTLGILDRPLEHRGRVAYYGPRHLLQLVAIKQLQAQGARLAQIQQMMLGADEQKLLGLAQIPPSVWKQWCKKQTPTPGQAVQVQAAAQEPATGAGTGEKDRLFWQQQVSVGSASAPQPVAPPARGQSLSQPSWVQAWPALHLQLAAGVTLVLEGVSGKQLHPRQFWLLRRETQRVLEALARLGLLPTSRESLGGTLPSRAAQTPAAQATPPGTSVSQIPPSRGE